MAITDAVLDELLKDYEKPEELLGQTGLRKQLQKRLLEKAMGAELTVPLGYGKHDPAGKNSGNSRNGTSPKTLKGGRTGRWKRFIRSCILGSWGRFVLGVRICYPLSPYESKFVVSCLWRA